jgi:putative ABC transport system permease protein
LAEKQPGVRAAAVSTGVPPYYGFQDFYRAEDRGDSQFDLISYQVDDHFVGTLGIEILQGRGFSDAFGSDSTSVILNESAVERLGWDEPIGKRIEYPSRGFYTVVGVMRDFNFLSMHQPISPFALFHTSSKSYDIPDSYVTVQVAPRQMESTVEALERAWTSMAPGTPFEYSFLDENFEGQYESEQRLGWLFLVFSGLAIVIACLGLFGLATFSVERRKKEIGVRKTLGASVPGVVGLLSREFTRWVLVANLIAWPVAWFVMDRWLQNFAYRVSIGPSVFLLAGAAAFSVAATTIIWQTVRAAVADPVEALHYE